MADQELTKQYAAFLSPLTKRLSRAIEEELEETAPNTYNQYDLIQALNITAASLIENGLDKETEEFQQEVHQQAKNHSMQIIKTFIEHISHDMRISSVTLSAIHTSMMVMELILDQYRDTPKPPSASAE